MTNVKNDQENDLRITRNVELFSSRVNKDGKLRLYFLEFKALKSLHLTVSVIK